MRYTEIAPADTHLNYFANKILALHGTQPKKEMCLRHKCDGCSYYCVISNLRQFFGKALGYLQTVSYIHVKELCKKRKCYACVLRKRGLCKIKG
ncbi:MAG: hypothetical protein QXZ10_01960 [Sulfolobales archaeon]